MPEPCLNPLVERVTLAFVNHVSNPLAIFVLMYEVAEMIYSATTAVCIF